jgi:Protein of unknown function (DUF2917)
MSGTWPWKREGRGTGTKDLATNTTLRVHPGRHGAVLRAERGLVLVTQTGDREDHVLAPGEELRLPRGGLVVALALAAARLAVRDAPARDVRRLKCDPLLA